MRKVAYIVQTVEFIRDARDSRRDDVHIKGGEEDGQDESDDDADEFEGAGVVIFVVDECWI